MSFKYFYCRLRLWQILAILLFSFTDAGLAESIESYCISKTPSEISSERINNVEDNLLQTEKFYIGTEEYIVESLGGNNLQLKKYVDKHVISELEYFYAEYGRIRFIQISKDNLVFIHTDKNNYISRVIDKPEVRLTSPSTLPRIFPTKCQGISWFLGECYVSLPNYSPTLDRIFISGHRYIAPRQEWQTIQSVYAGTKTLISSTPVKYYLADLPSLEGVLLQGFKGELLFFNGNNIVELSKDFSYNKHGKSLSIKQVKVFDENEKGIYEARIFIDGFVDNKKKQRFLMELKKDLSLRSIAFPQEMSKEWIKIFMLPNDPSIWILSKSAILFEKKGKLENIVTFPPASQIVSPTYVRQLLDGSISFDIEDIDNHFITTYFLKRASPTANCEIMLNDEKPMLLQLEVSN